MNSARLLKTLFIASWITGIAWTLWGLAPGPASAESFGNPLAPEAEPAAMQSGDYVGSEACQACHDVESTSFSHTAHSRAFPLRKVKGEGCETCHGPGKAHVDGGGDKTKIRTFENETPKQISENCLGCHAGKEEHNNFRRGEHWRNDVSCTDCHSPHASATPEPKPKGDGSSSLIPVGPFAAHASDFAPRRMLKKHQVLLCMSCHNETKSQFNRPFHHRVLEGAMNCSDCHNPHGGFELKQARLSTGADAACFKCHADKQGPFVFEHAPLKVEGCSACHDPHGSSNPKLLKRSVVAQLCIECHSNVGVVPGEEPSGAAQVPHDLSNPRYRNCTICHVKIHGSNSSSRFFR
jgi:predicted CXXCH cytochrome family protein